MPPQRSFSLLPTLLSDYYLATAALYTGCTLALLANMRMHSAHTLPTQGSLVAERLCTAAVLLQDVTAVVDTCHAAGISKKAVKLRPIAVVKG